LPKALCGWDLGTIPSGRGRQAGGFYDSKAFRKNAGKGSVELIGRVACRIRLAIYRQIKELSEYIATLKDE